MNGLVAILFQSEVFSYPLLKSTILCIAFHSRIRKWPIIAVIDDVSIEAEFVASLGLW